MSCLERYFSSYSEVTNSERSWHVMFHSLVLAVAMIVKEFPATPILLNRVMSSRTLSGASSTKRVLNWDAPYFLLSHSIRPHHICSAHIERAPTHSSQLRQGCSTGGHYGGCGRRRQGEKQQVRSGDWQQRITRITRIRRALCSDSWHLCHSWLSSSASPPHKAARKGGFIRRLRRFHRFRMGKSA